MNIFYLDSNPTVCAQYHNDRHTVKMIVEYAQLLSTAHRVIDGVPKMEYWVQMQVQMEVCNLNECDFLETRFIEYDNEEAYYAETDNSKPRGMMMCFNNGGRPLYVYSEWGISKEDLEVWEQKQMEQYSNYVWINNIYWKLEEVSCVLVLRNKLWYNYAKPMIDEIAPSSDLPDFVSSPSDIVTSQPQYKNKASIALVEKVLKEMDKGRIQVNSGR